MDKDTKESLKRAYKEARRPAGVYRIQNTVTGNIFIGSSVDVNARINRHRAELSFICANNPGMVKELQDDLKRHGPESFTFDVLEVLDGEYDTDAELREDLKMLEQIWREKYNLPPEKKHTTPDSPAV